jgi:DNA (cytosine-5)-methyltransferase 1
MLNCVDLFSGAGGFSLAAGLAGFRVRLAIENNPWAIKSYRENICCSEHCPLVIAEDISNLDAYEIYSQVFDRSEKCDLLLGGPPCQGFSTHRINNAGISDKRNDLIHTYFEFVRAFSPTMFLLENVPGMLWPRHAATLEHFYDQGKLAGYNIYEPVILDARDYGVPQRRRRVFILGVQSGENMDIVEWPPPKSFSKIIVDGDDTKKKWLNCETVFGDAPAGDPNDIHMMHSDELIKAFERTPQNGGSRKESGRLLPCHERHDGHKDVYGRINPFQPAPTMTTACINPSKGRFVHPTLNHGITVRQAARIQTFPDWFVFYGGLTAAGIQIGNAVPIHLGRALIDHLRKYLEGSQGSPLIAADQVKEFSTK